MFNKSLLAAVVLSFGFIYSVQAKVCFLPDGECVVKAERGDCGNGYTLSRPKGEGWDCSSCGGKYKCEESQCPAGYEDQIECDDDESYGERREVKISKGYRGNHSCDKCVKLKDLCAAEGARYVKTDRNTCTGACSYNYSSGIKYYEVCSCPNYNLGSNTNSCMKNYEECDVGDAAHTKYYKAEDNHRCVGSQYFEQGHLPSEANYNCEASPSCTECDGKKYYICTELSCPEHATKVSGECRCNEGYVERDGACVVACNAIEGKYYTEAECKTANQIASNNYFERVWEAVVNNTLPIKEAFAANKLTVVSGSNSAALINTSDLVVSAQNGNLDIQQTTSGYMVAIPGGKSCPCPKEGPGSGAFYGYDNSGKLLYYDVSDCCLALREVNPEIFKNNDITTETLDEKVCKQDSVSKCWYAVGEKSQEECTFNSQSDCENMGWKCEQRGECWQRSSVQVTYNSTGCLAYMLQLRKADGTVVAEYKKDGSGWAMIEPGEYELFVVLSSSKLLSYTINGSNTQTISVDKAYHTGSAIIGTYNFSPAGSAFHIVGNCDSSTSSSTSSDLEGSSEPTIPDRYTVTMSCQGSFCGFSWSEGAYEYKKDALRHLTGYICVCKPGYGCRSKSANVLSSGLSLASNETFAFAEGGIVKDRTGTGSVEIGSCRQSSGSAISYFKKEISFYKEEKWWSD